MVQAIDLAGGTKLLHGKVEFIRFTREGEIDRRIFGFKSNAPADDYRKKAEAFVEKIRPHLSRKFEQGDAMEHLVDLMPLGTLKIHRRQLINEFRASST